MTAPLQAPADGWVDLDEHQLWQMERAQAVREIERRRAELAEQNAYLERQAEAESARDAAVMTRTLSGEPVPTIGDILARAAAHVPEPIPRDAGQPYGSEENIALYADGADVGRPAAQRPAAARAALLARARRAGDDPFMLGQVALLERRQAAARPEVSRSAPVRYEDTRSFDKPSACRDCGHLQCHCYTWRADVQGPVRQRRQGPCDEWARDRCPGCQANGAH